MRQGDLIAFTPNTAHPRHPASRTAPAAKSPTCTPTAQVEHHPRRSQTAESPSPPTTSESLRLAYAQHIYRQQGATVERAIVLTGGWQTSKETAYVEATRARQRTDWHIARDDLDPNAQDPDRITRLAQRMRKTRAQTPSLTYNELPDPIHQLDPTHLTWPQPPHPEHPQPQPEHER